MSASLLTSPKDIDAAAEAAVCVRKTHEALVDYLKAGQTLPEIDGFVGSTLKSLGCKSSFFRYRIPKLPPFPSQSCISVNECIVHGTHTMSSKPLEPGDIISIDIGVEKRGWIGDAAWTYAIEHASDDALRLMRAGRESLAAGIDAMQPGRPLLDWARAVQRVAMEEAGFHIVKNLGGHGYGKKLHGPPFIANRVPAFRAEWPDAWLPFAPGMLIAVEPMLAIGTDETHAESRSWPIFTADGSLSVHYEADVLITPDGPRDLTTGMDQLPDIVGG
ncbi:MAG: type I methionyl aminopeptidase [Planctomycetota bacterium]